MKHILATGQDRCWDARGEPIDCGGTGHDGQVRAGIGMDPSIRFQTSASGDEPCVFDGLTGLTWSRDASPSTFPMTWQEALDYVSGLNKEKFCGHDDWRLPNRRELRSLVWHQSMNPPLPPGHPFENIFHGWYWTSTTAAINTRYAWYVHMGGARMFYGRKDQECLVWPVRGSSPVLPRTGQSECWDSSGSRIPCPGTGQDRDLRKGVKWPEPRFHIVNPLVVQDRLTGLLWARDADLASGLTDWQGALELTGTMSQEAYGGISSWRLPNINELESLVDASRHTPALPKGHPFKGAGEFYWSSTTSFYDPQWAWALYLFKGAVGVGMKKGRHFHVMAVSG